MGTGRTLLGGAIVAAFVWACAACTEKDDALFSDIGVTRLLLVDPDLEGQRLEGQSDGAIQSVEWEVSTATVQSDAGELDLLVGERCTISSSIFVPSSADGPCSEGVVVESTKNPDPMRLALITTMKVSRATPRDLLDDDQELLPGDSDGDGVENNPDASTSVFDDPCEPGVLTDCDDNCPLVSNGAPPGGLCPQPPPLCQADSDGDGVGDACTVVIETSGVFIAVPDSDADGVADFEDNCLWKANPDQDSSEPIGSECLETSVVTLVGKSPFSLTLGPEDIEVIEGLTTFVTADFAGTLDCNWVAASCTVDPAAVELCGQPIVAGCPD